MPETDFFEAVDELNDLSDDEPPGDDWFEAVDELDGDPDAGRETSAKPTLIPELETHWGTYMSDDVQMQCEPLRVMLTVSGKVGGYDAPTLDGILARMVTDEALGGQTLDRSGSPYLLPVPLFRLWTDPETGLPLWAANPFAPHGPSERVTEYWHKRSIRPTHAKKQKGQKTPYKIKGRYKEKRVPLPAQTARHWWADCIGYRHEILRLMKNLDTLGKKRMAVVQDVRVKRIDRFRMDRPVPVRYFDDEADVEPRGYTGWTPPYWLADAQAECAVPHRMPDSPP